MDTEVIIIGAGPIGIELAVALQRSGVSHLILEAGPIGQTMSWWAPHTRWFSSPERIAISGVPLITPDQSKATREQYLDYLRSVVLQFNLNVRCFEKVIQVQPDGESFLVQSNTKEVLKEYHCSKVVLAIGGTDHPKKLGIPGESLPHVDGYLRDPHRYFGRRVLIVGGRNSAVEAALRLHNAGAHVTLSYRKPQLPEESIKYWLLPEIKSLLKSGRIQNMLGTEPVTFRDEYAVLQRTDGETVEIPTDDVLTLIGYSQDKALMQNIGIELVGESLRPQFDALTMETNIPGIYVAGTAVAGTQTSRYKTFLENCHDHVDRIVAHITGSSSNESVERIYADQADAMPES